MMPWRLRAGKFLPILLLLSYSRTSGAVYGKEAADLVARIDSGLERLALVQQEWRGSKRADTQRTMASVLATLDAGKEYPHLLNPTLTSLAEAAEAECLNPRVFRGSLGDPGDKVEGAMRAWCNLYAAPHDLLRSIPATVPPLRWADPGLLAVAKDIEEALGLPVSPEDLQEASGLRASLRFAEEADSLQKRLHRAQEDAGEEALRDLRREWAIAQSLLGEEVDVDPYEHAIAAYRASVAHSALQKAISLVRAPKSSRASVETDFLHARKALDVSPEFLLADLLIERHRRTVDTVDLEIDDFGEERPDGNVVVSERRGGCCTML